MTARSIGFSDDASVTSSSSGRSLSGGGARDLGGANVPRHILLKRRVLGMAQYANEQRRGGNASLSQEDRRRLYGGSVIPIAVPLLPGESVDEHEANFESWLDKRGFTLAGLRDQANKERSLRTSFALHKLQTWNRDRQREPSMTISFPNTGKRTRSSDGEEELDDDEKYAPASSKRVCRDTTNRSAHELLRTHILSVSEYRDKVKRGAKLTNSIGTQPIAVPLFPGETADEYERRFQAFLSTLSMDLSRLADEPNTERSVRMLFARKRLTGGPPPPLDSGKTRIVQATHTPSILSRVSDARTPSASDEAESVETKRIVEPVVIEPSQDPVDPKLRFPTHCSFRPPPAGPDETSIPKAYLACGCRKCLLRCASRLVRQVAELQRELAASASASAAASRSSDMMDTVMDLTQASEAASPPPPQASAASAPQARRFDVAKMLQITSLIKSRRQTHVSSSTSTSTSSRLATGDSDDPIALQLCSQYDEINERVVENERVLENASRELQGTRLAQSEQLQQASMTQDENLELRACIEEEKDHRDAALALLVVYVWRHAPLQLQQRIEHPSVSDVVHVTRACRHKCALLASELSRHRSQASSLKQRLDAVLRGSVVETVADEDAESLRLEQLQRLGEQLTSVEEAMQTIHKTRQRELLTLLHFDSHVRRLVAALLTETRAA